MEETNLSKIYSPLKHEKVMIHLDVNKENKIQFVGYEILTMVLQWFHITFSLS